MNLAALLPTAAALCLILIGGTALPLAAQVSPSSAPQKFNAPKKRGKPASSLSGADSLTLSSLVAQAGALTADLQRAAKAASIKSVASIKSLGDSLINISMAELTAERKDFLALATQKLVEPIDRFAQTFFIRQDSALASFTALVQRPKPERNLLEKFRTARQEDAEAFQWTMTDTLSLLRDSLYTYGEALLIEQVDLEESASEKDATLASLLARFETGIGGQGSSAPASQLVVSTTLLSKSVWRGTDQNNGKPVVSPVVSYYHSSGAYGSVSASVLTGQTTPLDQWTLTAGYSRAWTDDFTAGISYSRYFYTDSSTQSKSVLSNDVSLSLYYDTPVLSPSLSATFAFGSGISDFYSSASLSHQFLIDDVLGGVMALDPTVSANFGTLNTTRVALIPTRRRPATQTTSQFGITNIDLSLPVTLQTGMFSIQPELVCTFPINNDKVTTAFGTAPVTQSNTIFYFVLSLSASF